MVQEGGKLLYKLLQNSLIFYWKKIINY